MNETTAVTELSPATQAVLDAFQYVIKGTLPSEDRESLAAALRALVDACSFEDFNTRLISVSDVIAIAAELESMADLSPNVEVVLSSDLFNDDPCLESMSAPALAALDAYMIGWGWLDSPTKKDCRGVAAALRAAADQVVPNREVAPQQDLESRREAMVWGMLNQTQVTRHQLLAIVTELEAV